LAKVEAEEIHRKPIGIPGLRLNSSRPKDNRAELWS